MTERRGLERRMVGAPGPDSGCAGGLDLLDVYVEAELASLDAARRYPAVASHLAACPDCREDHEALMELAKAGDVRRR